jgi:phage terminase large subunit-like protein
MGASVDEPTLLDEFEKERQKGTKSLIGFYAKHLNVQPGMAARSDTGPEPSSGRSVPIR